MSNSVSQRIFDGLVQTGDDCCEGVSQQAWLLPTLYFLLNVAHQDVRVGRKTYVADIAEGNERSDYVTISNTAIGFILFFTGVIGALGAVFSVPLVVPVMALLGIVGAIMGYRLPEA